MSRVTFFSKLVFSVFLAVPSLASDSDELLNQKLTELFRPNWPYEAFLAIPRIAEMLPILEIEISEEDGDVYSSNCVNIIYFELQKKIDPETVLERKSLHKLLCRAMKRAVEKTPTHVITQNFPDNHNIVLSFDFFNGVIKTIEIPYPPLDPLMELENVFIDEGVILGFGNIDFPGELELEINQTPL